VTLVKCQECGAEISDRAKVCPRCGVARSLDEQGKTRIGIATAVVLAPLALFLAFPGKPPAAQGKHRGQRSGMRGAS
jgi:hypothetical protein